ncbi:hypothetical protein KSF78_0006845 [Schistosoma japonicum]|nr:hypothetical protein KSF78_0006845 [Schistosoma japonicum]
MTTTTTTTSTSVRSSITTPNRNPRVPLTKTNKPTTNKADSSLILRTGRIDSSTNLTSTSTNASRSNLTDRSRGRFSYQTSYKESTQSSKANVKPPFSVGGRRVSAGAASLTSQRTVPSQLNRSKASLQTRGSVPPSNTGLTDSRSNIRGASSATRQTITQRRGVNRGFMTPTTSSDAKQVKVKESIRSVPNESPISSSPKCDSRRTYESPIGNSAKKPVTSTFLRRGTIQGCRNGGISRKFSTDNINQYSLNPNKSSSTCISDLTASVVATIEAYDDPKAYLFYRMFQGSEEIEATTGGIFQAFSPYSFNFKQNFSSEFNSNEQLNINSQSYEIDEQFPNFQTSYVHNESMKQSSSLSLSHPPQQQQQQQPSLPSQKSTDIQNKHTEMSISTDDEETPYQDLPSDCFDLTTTSTSMNRPLTEKTSLYTSKSQNIIEASIVNNSKVHCTVIDNNDKITDPTLKSMNLSMLVSTSVTSLTPSQTGTYIIDGVGGDDDNNNVDDKNINDEDLLQHSDRQNIHFSNDNDLSTPRGSPVISDSGEEESSKHQQTIKLPLHNSMSFSVEHVNTCLTNQYSLKKRLNDTISTVDLTKTSLNENSIEFMRTGSNVCLTKNRDDSKNKRTGLQATDDLEDSDVVGASLTSLTPSHAGTYILDIDDTLVAQGILPVIIRSHETLASSLTDSGLNTESMNTHAVENATPRGGSPTFKEKLWNVVETDESKDDLLLMTSVASKFDQVGGPYNVSVDFDNDELTTQLKMESLRAEFEDTYKLLPSPNQFLNAMNTVDPSFSESESHTSQMKTTTYSVHGKECIRTIPLVVNTSNTSSLQSMNYFAKPTLLSSTSTSLTNCTQVVVSSNSTLQNDLITTVQSKANIVSCPHKDGMHSTVHLNPTDGVSHQTSINLKLPDNSLSTSSSSDNPSTSSSCSNHVLKSNMEVFNRSDLNNQNIEHITMMYNINDDSVLNEHHSAYNNVYIKRRNSEIHNQSQFQSNDQHNSNNFIPSNGNHLYNLSENIGNNCHITISRRRDSEIIKDQQMINSNYYTKMTTTPSSSSVLRDQLLARLHSMPTAYNSRPNRIQNMNRTHSYNRRKSQQYPHGSASVPDPASPVRSCEKRPDHFPNPTEYNRTILSHYKNDDMKSAKPTEVDSRTYTRRKHSHSNEQNDLRNYLTTLDAESYQTWIIRMSELAQGLNSLAKEPLFQSDSSFNEDNKNESEANGVHPEARKMTLPLLNDTSKTMPTLPDSTTGPSLTDVERSAFTTPLPHRYSLEAVLAASKNLSIHQKIEQTTLNPNDTSNNVYLPIAVQSSGKTDEKFSEFPLSPLSFPLLSPNFDPNNSDPNESAIYYSLMVDTIRYLSIKLRQFSDKLAYRLSHNQQQTASGSNKELTNCLLSSQRIQADVQSSTKYALHDTFENMKAVNQQLQVVGKLLFSNNNDNTTTNELNQLDSATSCEYLHKLEQLNQELNRFIPIEPATIHQSHHIATSTTQLSCINSQLLSNESNQNVDSSSSTSIIIHPTLMTTTSTSNIQYNTTMNSLNHEKFIHSINKSKLINSSKNVIYHQMKSTTSDQHQIDSLKSLDANITPTLSYPSLSTASTITTVHSTNVIHDTTCITKSNNKNTDNIINNKQELLDDEYY